VPKETPQQCRMAGQASALAGHRGLDVCGGVGGEVREATILEVAPEELDRVEVRRIRRKPDEMAAQMRGEPGLHERVAVRAPTIPEQDEGPAHVAGEMAQKPQDFGAPNVAVRMQGQRERDAPAPGRHDQRPNAGDLLVRARPHGHRRGRTAQSPRPAEHRHHQEPRFIEADEMGAEAVEFFLPRPSRPGATRVPDGRRALSRVVGVAAD